MTVNFKQILGKHFHLNWHGIHGAPHWARVCRNGKLLAELLPSVNLRIVRYFALFHDFARRDDGADPGHGARSVALLHQLGGAALLDMPDPEFIELCGAIEQHSSAKNGGTINQQVCWDADRLDLWRIQIMPDPDRLFTDAAKALHHDRLFGGYYKTGIHGSR